MHGAGDWRVDAIHGAGDWRADACRAQETGAPHAMQAQKTDRVLLMRGQSAADLSAAESAAAIHLNTVLLAEGIDRLKACDGDRADPFAGIHV